MKHLEEIGETYWQHFAFAIRLGFVLFITGILVMIHAVFPNIFKSVAIDVIQQANAILKIRSGNDEDDDVGI